MKRVKKDTLTHIGNIRLFLSLLSITLERLRLKLGKLDWSQPSHLNRAKILKYQPRPDFATQHPHQIKREWKQQRIYDGHPDRFPKRNACHRMFEIRVFCSRTGRGSPFQAQSRTLSRDANAPRRVTFPFLVRIAARGYFSKSLQARIIMYSIVNSDSVDFH